MICPSIDADGKLHFLYRQRSYRGERCSEFESLYHQVRTEAWNQTEKSIYQHCA